MTTRLSKERTISQWFDSPFGQYMLDSQRELLARKLPVLGGYHMMQLGITPDDKLLESYGHSHKFYTSSSLKTEGAMVADFEQLPLPSDTIDTALLHHVLEFSDNPHQVLNETARVISPGGHLILVVFNPVSSFGLLRLLLSLLSSHNVWKRHRLRSGRLCDWLRLLGFQPMLTLRGCHQLPIQWQPYLKKMQFLNGMDGKLAVCGTYYVIVARKQVAPLTPIEKRYFNRIKIPAVEKTSCQRELVGDGE